MRRGDGLGAEPAADVAVADLDVLDLGRLARRRTRLSFRAESGGAAAAQREEGRMAGTEEGVRGGTRAQSLGGASNSRTNERTGEHARRAGQRDDDGQRRPTRRAPSLLFAIDHEWRRRRRG